MESLGGVIFALCAAALWSVAPLAFAAAGRRIGPFRVNLLRIAIGTTVLVIVLGIAHLIPAWRPVLPGSPQVMWLALSGIAGMSIGDALYYDALVRLGPRRALQILTLAPVGSALLAFAWLGETLRPNELFGIAVVMSAVAYAIYIERKAEGDVAREPGRVSTRGVVNALLAALCMGFGAVLTRQAFTSQPDLSTLAATTVRVGSAAVILWIVPLVSGTAGRVASHLADPHVRSRIAIGTIAGPLLGMSCYVAALKYAKAGTVSTLSSMSPIMIIPLVAWRYKTRVRKRAVAAALVAIVGVALISWRR
jgi:drug/metabolite transporter (DMT)-like permease